MFIALCIAYSMEGLTFLEARDGDILFLLVSLDKTGLFENLKEIFLNNV